MILRKRIFEIIQPDDGTSTLSRVFDRLITALILASVVIVFAGTFDLQPNTRRVLFAFENIGANQFFKFLNLIDFDEILRHGIETETVVRLEIDIGFHGGKNTQ
jgi:hypothetical protein